MEQQQLLGGEPPWWGPSPQPPPGRTIAQAREKRRHPDCSTHRQHSSFDREPPEYTKYLNGVPAALRGSDGVYRRLHQHAPPVEPEPPAPRRGPRPASLRMFLLSMGALSLLLMMYIPAYKQANSRPDLVNNVKRDIKSFGSVAGWSYNTSRDTRTYVLPDNVTVLNQPRSVCRPNKQPLQSTKLTQLRRHSTPGPPKGENKHNSDEIFLLVIVCSSMDHFEARAAIRESWGNQTNYEQLSKRIHSVDKLFAKINITDKILNEFPDPANLTLSDRRVKRELSADYEDDEDFDIPPYPEDSALNDVAIFDKFNSLVEDSSLELNNSLSINDSFHDYVKDISGVVTNVDVGNDNLKQSSKLVRDFIGNDVERVKNGEEYADNASELTNIPMNRRRFKRMIATPSKIVKQNTLQEDNIPDVDFDPRFDHGLTKVADVPEDFFQSEETKVDYYDYQTEVSNIMRIPKRGEKSSDEDNELNNAINSAKDLLKLSIKDNKLNLAFHPSDTNNVESKPPSKFIDTNIITNVKEKSSMKSENSNINSYKDMNKQADPLSAGQYTEVNSVYSNQNINNPNTIDDTAKPPEQEQKLVQTRYLFLLGQSINENDTELQSRIDEEANMYGDIIQEGFVDSYNNLTLKSVMLLKWVVTNCGKKVRYVMKTDDDMFINIPQLVDALQNKSQEFQKQLKKAPRIGNREEVLLMGDLICGARPIADTSSKWYSPTYMFGGKIYPRYLSGTSYVMSVAAAAALYHGALDTPLFHLEDIYITGMVSRRIGIRPLDHPGFSYWLRSFSPCVYAQLITAHRVKPAQLHVMWRALMRPGTLEGCMVQRRREHTKKATIGSILSSLRSVAEGKKKKKRVNNGCF